VRAIGPYTHGPYPPVIGASLPIVVAVLLVALHCGRRRGQPNAPCWYRASLAVCLALAAGNYVAFGEFRFGSYMNEWDVAHYYTGTK
jgi:hypothetical protein